MSDDVAGGAHRHQVVDRLRCRGVEARATSPQREERPK